MRCYAALALAALLAAPAAAAAADDCGLEPGYTYNSLWNETALRLCPSQAAAAGHADLRVCIIGGGSSGTHLGWLLRRRGYSHTVVFERNDRLGGEIWTRQPLGGGSGDDDDTVRVPTPTIVVSRLRKIVDMNL
jgi:hypothetical protein